MWRRALAANCREVEANIFFFEVTKLWALQSPAAADFLAAPIRGRGDTYEFHGAFEDRLFAREAQSRALPDWVQAARDKPVTTCVALPGPWAKLVTLGLLPA